MNSILNAPVLFLVFNRPEKTRIVFKAIREARPTRLYVASDGPREENESETEQVELVREIATSVDWDCELTTLFRKENLGCKTAVSSAITWFFENEESGIILEDDCLPSPLFFPYCQELLERYWYDYRVMAISGDNFQDGKSRTSSSYYFSRNFHCWGWASWRRAWRLYDVELSTWPDIKGNGFLKDIGYGDQAFQEYWTWIFDRVFKGEIDTWDYQWVYTCWTQHGLTILPNVNLVSNIGFGDGATHTQKKNSSLSNLPIGLLKFPIKHPVVMIRNGVADKYEDKHVYHIENKKISLMQKVKSLFTT